MGFRPGVDDAKLIVAKFYRGPFSKGKNILGKGHIVTLWNDQDVWLGATDRHIVSALRELPQQSFQRR
jgi:hypothetical protein